MHKVCIFERSVTLKSDEKIRLFYTYQLIIIVAEPVLKEIFFSFFFPSGSNANCSHETRSHTWFIIF